MKKSENVLRSESLHSKASLLLSSVGLLEILRKYGQVVLHGSYAANLMMQGDIDIYVVSPRGYTMLEIIKVYNEVVLTSHYEQQTIWNWDRKTRKAEWRRSDGLSGHYVYLQTRWEDVKWKIDIWFIDEDELEKDSERFNVMNESVTPEEREAILAFKEIRNEAEIDYCSQKIYKLVLEEGVTSRIKFRLLLAKEKIKQWFNSK